MHIVKRKDRTKFEPDRAKNVKVTEEIRNGGKDKVFKVTAVTRYVIGGRTRHRRRAPSVGFQAARNGGDRFINATPVASGVKRQFEKVVNFPKFPDFPGNSGLST